jgi:hypothetical protein
MKNSHTVTTKGARGTTLVQSTGVDKSSMGDKSTMTLKNSGFKGGAHDASSSIAGASTRKI